MDSFQDRIKGLRFTKTEKRIADYILENQKTVGLETAVKIAEKLDVTDMSVHRFLRKLGYSGFAEFRDEMNAQLIEHYEDSWKELSPGKKYLQTSNTIGDGDVAGLVVFQAMANIKKSMEQTEASLFVDVAECILRGRRKYVIGFRGSSSLASYMNRKLTVFLPGVHALLAADSSVIEELIDLTDRDVIIMYSFPRYSTLNESILDIAGKKGSKVVLFTDKLTSPLAVYADYVIPVEIEGAGHTNSYVAPMCLSEIIILLLSRKISKADQKRIEELDEYINRNRLY